MAPSQQDQNRGEVSPDPSRSHSPRPERFPFPSAPKKLLDGGKFWIILLSLRGFLGLGGLLGPHRAGIRGCSSQIFCWGEKKAGWEEKKEEGKKGKTLKIASKMVGLRCL